MDPAANDTLELMGERKCSLSITPMRDETTSRTFLSIFSWKLKGQFSQLVKDFFFFFSPSLCHLILFPLWKQQIYAWSWTGKNWTLLPAGILPWRAAGSDERFHPEQIREYSTMSLFAQGTLLGRQEQGLSWCAPTSLGQSVRWGGAWGKTVRFLPASSVPNVTK